MELNEDRSKEDKLKEFFRALERWQPGTAREGILADEKLLHYVCELVIPLIFLAFRNTVKGEDKDKTARMMWGSFVAYCLGQTAGPVNVDPQNGKMYYFDPRVRESAKSFIYQAVFPFEHNNFKFKYEKPEDEFRNENVDYALFGFGFKTANLIKKFVLDGSPSMGNKRVGKERVKEISLNNPDNTIAEPVRSGDDFILIINSFTEKNCICSVMDDKIDMLIAVTLIVEGLNCAQNMIAEEMKKGGDAFRDQWGSIEAEFPCKRFSWSEFHDRWHSETNYTLRTYLRQWLQKTKKHMVDRIKSSPECDQVMHNLKKNF